MSNKLPSRPGSSQPEEAVQLSPHAAPHPAPHPAVLEDLPQAGEQGMSWRRYVAAVMRYKWLLLLLLVAGTAAGVGISRLTEPQYLARSRIWIERSDEWEAGPIRPRELLQASAWLQLLRSDAVLAHVVNAQRLYLQVESPADSGVLASFQPGNDLRPGAYRLAVDNQGRSFTLATEDGTILQRGRVGEPVGQKAGFVWTPPAIAFRPGRVIEFTVQSPGEAATALADKLTPEIDENGRFLQIKLTGNDPRQITATVNAVAERFIEVAADLKKAALEQRTEILNEQLQYAGNNLRTAEIALAEFRVSTATLPSDRAAPVPGGLAITQDPVYSSFFDLRIQLEQVRRDRDALQRALAKAAESGISVSELEVIPSVQASTELRQLLSELSAKRGDLRALQSRYTDEWPAVKKAVADIETLERQTIPRVAGNLLSQLAAQEQDAQTRIASASGELRQIPTRAIEETRLARQVSSAENLYRHLRDRFEASRLAAASSVPDVRLLDAATVPETPINTENQTQTILMALLASLALGVFGSILLDRMDPRLRYPEQVTQGMGLNILGAIPHAGDPKRRLGSESTAQVVEAFREVRLNVAHAYGAAGPVVVTITSPGIGDGKSFVASNLALAFADQGYRTLLIDGDIRRGGLHRLFERERKPGLTDYLSGRATREEVVQKTAYPALHLIGCGTRMKGGPELLGTPAMPRLLAELRSSYSVILIDSPPLGAGVDSFALGTLTGNLLLVLRTGNTNRELAEAKLELLDRLPIRILGAVLNDVPGHGIYRRYSYLSGYEAQDEALADGSGAKALQGV